MNELAARFKAWLHAPFTQNMDLLQLFLLTGLILIFVVLWGPFINRIRVIQGELT